MGSREGASSQAPAPDKLTGMSSRESAHKKEAPGKGLQAHRMGFATRTLSTTFETRELVTIFLFPYSFPAEGTRE